ncbi:hypothetical protein DFH27DRAFT_564500 [Peziza echinospora]|nr:hypothetical protein DFH27DRAFT_564500 [Peziza echinospora]
MSSTTDHGVSWSAGEAVTVNTRALIDKVLARYSAKHTVFRELFQNASDANAKNIVIRWESTNPIGHTDQGPGKLKRKQEDSLEEGENTIQFRKKLFLRGRTPSQAKSKPTTSISSSSTDPEVQIEFNPTLQKLLYEELPEGSLQKRRTYRRLKVENDGKAFAPADWARLKRIAEGNPDETKIGAFGVGFYSVFSECDEPTVYSGGAAMAFYWDGGPGGTQLMTRIAKVPAVEKEGMPGVDWTVLSMPYREPTPLPDLPELIRFLATSLVFVRLESITVYVDDFKLVRIEKHNATASSPVEIPTGPLSTATASIPDAQAKESGIEMKLAAADVRIVKMKAYCMAGIFPVDREVRYYQEGSDGGKFLLEKVSLEVTTGQIVTSVTTALAAELTRAILKPPPKLTTISMVAADLMSRSASKALHVFSHIVPLTTPQDELPDGKALEAGKVFIGFQTQQTTGFQCHISTHSVIPTVERESIDFYARHVSLWNIEMLKMAGVLTRCMYERDLLRLQGESARLKQKKEATFNVDSAAKHMMQKYAFRESTPSHLVGATINKAFFDFLDVPGMLNRCQIRSSQGFTNITSVWFPVSRLSSSGRQEVVTNCDWLLEDFLTTTPLITRSIIDASPSFVKMINDRIPFKIIQVAQILQDLGCRNIDVKEARALFSWLVKRVQRTVLPRLESKEALQILAIAVVKADAERGLGTRQGDGTMANVRLAEVDCYLSPAARLRKCCLPLPPSCIPTACLSDDLANNPEHLHKAFGWDELGAVEWIRHNCESGLLLDTDVEAATAALKLASDHWHFIDQEQRLEIKKLLQAHKCVPTEEHGLCNPTDVYFERVNCNIEISLPVLHSSLKLFIPDFLAFIGVRSSVDVRIILHILMEQATAAGVNVIEAGFQVQLIEHLMKAKEHVSEADMDALRSIAFCSAAGEKRLFRPNELYEPIWELNGLKLPVLRWPGDWSTTSPRAKRLLADLGLKYKPDLGTLVTMAANKSFDSNTRDSILKYMVENWEKNDYQKFAKELASHSVRFLPIIPPKVPAKELMYSYTEHQLSSVSGCFSNAGAGAFGHPVLYADMIPHASKFGVQEHPPLNPLLEYLVEHPPRDDVMAREMFTYLANFIDKLEEIHVRVLSLKEIVPVRAKNNDQGSGGSKIEWEYKVPSEVFTGTTSGYGDKMAQLFDYVDFGSSAAQFLMKIGAKSEHSDEDNLRLALKKPELVFSTLGAEEYQTMLKRFAASPSLWEANHIGRQMCIAPFLLGEKEVGEEDEFYGDHYSPSAMTVGLFSAGRILIVDDYNSYKYFRENIDRCPYDDTLERFYARLGGKKVSDVIQIQYFVGNTKNATEKANRWKKLVKERTPIFQSQSQEKFKFQLAPWLEGLSVQVVDTIRLERKFQIATIKEPMIATKQFLTAAIPTKMHNSRMDGSTLYITTPETYDVAYGLVDRLCEKSKPASVTLMKSLLEESLEVLDKRGINVKRILKEKEKAKIIEVHNNPSTQDNYGLEGDNEKNTLRSRDEIDRDLMSVIGATRVYEGAILESDDYTTINAEPATTCEHSPSVDIVYQETLYNGIMVFMQRTSRRMELMNEYRQDFIEFSKVATVLAGDVFGLDHRTISLCFEPDANEIAFNYKNSIFFNLHSWLAMGHHKCPYAESLPQWFTTLAHELAHNSYKVHGQKHSYLSEELASRFMPGLFNVIAEYGAHFPLATMSINRSSGFHLSSN